MVGQNKKISPKSKGINKNLTNLFSSFSVIQKENGGQSKKYVKPTDEEILAKYEDYLWKADQMKYMRAYVLCSSCIEYNKEYHGWELIDGRLVKTESMCPSCLKANADFNSSYYFLTKKDNDNDDE